MNFIRRAVTIGALFLSVPTVSRLEAQVVERPVPFDSAGQVYVMTPFIAERAALQAPWWPVAGDFTQARLYTANDSTYVLMVTRRTGVIERYMLTGSDRDAIRAIVSRLPRSVVEPRNDARNAFVRNQSILGVFIYGPAFAGAFADNDAAVVAGYLVVAGGTFFAASEISRRILVTRPQSDLSTNMGHNIALAGGAATYLFGGNDNAQAAGAFVGGVGGAALGLRIARRMTEADAIGAGFGSNISALIALGTMESLKRDPTCTQQTDGTFDCTGPRISDKAEVTVVLASGLIGYPLGVLYPRNATYNVTPGDIQTLYAATAVGILAGVTFLPDSPKESTAWFAGTAGGVLGMIAGDRFLVRRYDHSRGQGSRITLGTFAGGLMGAGVAALIDTDLPPPLIFGGATVGGLIGLIASEKYVDAGADAGRRGARISFNSASILSIATRTPGNHSLINVRF